MKINEIRIAPITTYCGGRDDSVLTQCQALCGVTLDLCDKYFLLRPIIEVTITQT